MKKMLLTGFLAMATMSQAAITVFLDSTTPSGGGNTAYNYHFEQTPGDVLRNGDFFTIYDIGGFVSASAPFDFNVSVQNNGLNPSTPVGGVAPALDSLMKNVSFIRAGGSTNAMSISGFEIISTLSGSSGMLAFTGQNAKNQSIQLSNGSLGAVPGPSPVPEPGTWAMLASGLGALTISRLRRRTQ